MGFGFSGIILKNKYAIKFFEAVLFTSIDWYLYEKEKITIKWIKIMCFFTGALAVDILCICFHNTAKLDFCKIISFISGLECLQKLW